MAKKINNRAFTDFSNINMRTRDAKILVREIVQGYEDNSMLEEGGVFSMNGRLNIRPRYQRVYVVDSVPYWKENLINSIICGFPINRIYLGVDENDPDGVLGNLEMLDGQQRTKTICDFVNGDFKITINGDMYHFANLPKEKQEKILNYGLDVTYCIGDEDARIAWFRRINQPNSILTNQEIRNAVYRGEWLELAKKFFSAITAQTRKQITDKNNKYCFSRYTKEKQIERCEYLEEAINWISYFKYPELRGEKFEIVDERIRQYMADNQHNTTAEEIISHYKKVIDWVNDVFFHNGNTPKTWQAVQNQDWKRLYAEYYDKELTEEEKMHITNRCKELVSYVKTRTFYDSKGIYEWVLRGEKMEEFQEYLCLRSFVKDDKEEMYNQQKGIDPIDGKHYEIEEMHAHHIIPWGIGGNSEIDNLVMLSSENHKNYHLGLFGITPLELKKKRDEVRKKNI